MKKAYGDLFHPGTSRRTAWELQFQGRLSIFPGHFQPLLDIFTDWNNDLLILKRDAYDEAFPEMASSALTRHAIEAVKISKQHVRSMSETLLASIPELKDQRLYTT